MLNFCSQTLSFKFLYLGYIPTSWDIPFNSVSGVRSFINLGLRHLTFGADMSIWHEWVDTLGLGVLLSWFRGMESPAHTPFFYSYLV